MKKKALLFLSALFICLAGFAGPRRDARELKYSHILLRDFRTVRDNEVYNFNIGTTAHGPGTIGVLRKFLPKSVEITVWANEPLEAPLQEMMDRHFPNIKIVHGSYDSPEEASPELKMAVDNADLLLVSSGNGIAGPIRPSLDNFMKFTDKPLAAYAIGFNRNQKKYLSSMDFAWFRDEISERMARNEEYTPAISGWAPDAVLYFDCADTQGAERFLAENELEKGKFICCLPGFRHTPSANMSPKNAADNEKHLLADNDILCRTIVDAVRKHGVKVLICAEQIPEMEICKTVIYDRLPEDVRSSCVYLKEFWTPDLALGIFKQSLCVFGIEMHSPVMALGNGVPSCVFRHSGFGNKSDMWNSLDVGEWLLDIDDADAASKATRIVDSILGNPRAARRKAAHAMKLADSASKVAIRRSFFTQPDPERTRKD